ncbi:WXG100 family type VII secretion target [Nocardia rhizosphaerihabitans]|uniref:WXG100 family type VII secretion target n=1 Tax=Nocardia rhizosphaerihabitans TaxID=1691570 RepID=A0ABQ2L3V7_9NOCA|nr:WXG100 family type VII secretion target [Nocardia rhizosphaerihabitans]GGO01286.1 hypothetical protein GCM10011610_71000 [Nocardia rhizosphaerihabitans]
MAGTPQVHLDFPTFQKCANDYAATIPPIDKTVDNLNAAVEAAKTGWEGAAKDAFKRFADELQAEILAVNKDLGIVSQALDTGEKKVASAEDQSVGGFTTLNFNYV